MTFTPLLALGTLVFTFVNFLKYVKAAIAGSSADKLAGLNGVVTQLIAWVAGIVGVAIAAHTQFASSITLGTVSLNKMNGATQVFIGLIATSILSTVNEVKKAVDNSDSAKAPAHLIGPQTPAK